MSKLKHLEELNQKISSLQNQLEQYQTLVKTVDRDNLPDGDVLAYSKDEFLTGCLSNDGSDIWCDGEELSMIGITHYIEQKDLIKLFKGDL